MVSVVPIVSMVSVVHTVSVVSVVPTVSMVSVVSHGVCRAYGVHGVQADNDSYQGICKRDMTSVKV